MAGGSLLPSSVYLGGASGNLSPTFFTSGAGTTVANSTIEGIGVVASLGADAAAVLQFNLPEVFPPGAMKLRMLAWANATTGNAIYTVADGGTAPGANIANTTLTTDASAVSFGFPATANLINEVAKVTLTGPGQVANNLYTVVVTFNTASWTLAATSVWQFSMVWE